MGAPFGVSCRGLAIEISQIVQIRNRIRPNIKHAFAQSTDAICNHISHGPFVGHDANDSFGNQMDTRLLHVSFWRTGALQHGRQRTHSAIDFHAFSLKVDHFPGSFIGAGKHIAEHHGVCPRSECDREMAGFRNPAIRAEWNSCWANRAFALMDSAHLGAADTGYAPRSTDRATSLANPNPIRTRPDKAQRRRSFGNVTDNHVQLKLTLYPLERLNDLLCVSMRHVDINNINSLLIQKRDTCLRILQQTDGGTHP